ncbi:MAG: leucyl aminopeptidase [Acetobacteraceae bacterium]|nr:leucyl aminopeptidase [Acetobacteraceae bacterium]
MVAIEFAVAAVPTEGALVLLAVEGAEPAAVWQQVDAACGGAIGRAAGAAEFTGKKGQTAMVLAPGAGLSRVLLVGLGKAADHTERGMELAAGTAVAALGRDSVVTIAADGMPAAHAGHAALGAQLRSYRFDLYRTKEGADAKPKLTTVRVLTDDVGAAKAAWPALEAIARGSEIARDLITEPPNVLYPAEMADRCARLSEFGLEVEVMGIEELTEKGFGALLAISQGSVREPRLVVMRWMGGEADAAPLCFVGKGVTFDTGGISLKPGASMGDMKWDMAGAGAVVGLMASLALRKAKANVVGVVGLSENMPAGNALRPGDVVTSLSGQTIEVLNTDAEGRLLLADAIWYAQERFKPVLTVDMATLTGAIIVSLGHEFAGMFSNDDTLATRLIAAGQATGEPVWRMPLTEAYDKLIKSDIADMKNIGGRPGGAIIGAQFVQRFVRGPWAHLDIAGMAWSSKDSPTVPKGATAFGLRLLDRLVADHFEA